MQGVDGLTAGDCLIREGRRRCRLARCRPGRPRLKRRTLQQPGARRLGRDCAGSGGNRVKSALFRRKLMSLYAIGLNHQTAPLAVREQVAFGVDALSEALRDLFGKRIAKEAAILSTCNRTEIY